MKLASHLHSVPRLRMHVAVPPLHVHLNDVHNDNSAYYATMDRKCNSTYNMGVQLWFTSWTCTAPIYFQKNEQQCAVVGKLI